MLATSLSISAQRPSDAGAASGDYFVAPRVAAIRKLLKHPVNIFPAGLLAGDSAGGEVSPASAGAWWLGHVRPRQEKVLAGELAARDIAYFLPTVHRKSITRGRTRTAEVPLFPGYIFICGSEVDRLTALKTNRLPAIHRVVEGECLRRQLKTLAELIAAGAPLVREARLMAGERVRIKSGPFRGVEGVILRRQGRMELLVAIDFLGQGASMEVEDFNTEPV